MQLFNLTFSKFNCFIFPVMDCEYLIRNRQQYFSLWSLFKNPIFPEKKIFFLEKNVCTYIYIYMTLLYISNITISRIHSNILHDSCQSLSLQSSLWKIPNLECSPRKTQSLGPTPGLSLEMQQSVLSAVLDTCSFMGVHRFFKFVCGSLFLFTLLVFFSRFSGQSGWYLFT